MSSQVTICPAEPGHAEAIAELLTEVDRFYGSTDSEPTDDQLRHIREALFGQSRAAHALLAWAEDRLVGFASYSFLWPASGSTQSLYLKELYVTDRHRGRGVGNLLMSHLCRIAAEKGCSRVEWTTDEDNAGALRFYQSLGCKPATSKVFYRLEGDRLQEQASTAV